VIDYLHDEGTGAGWILNANRFTIVGPPGTSLQNEPAMQVDRVPDSAAGGTNRVTWTGTVSEDDAIARRSFDAPTHYVDAYVAFGDQSTTPAQVTASLATETSPIWLDNVNTYVGPALLLYAFLLLGVLGLTRWAIAEKFDATLLAKIVIGTGAILLIVGGPAGLAGLAVVYLVLGTTALARPAAFRHSLVLSLASLAAVGVLYASLAFTRGYFDHHPFVVGLRQAIRHAAVGIAPVLGMLVARSVERSDSWLSPQAYGLGLGAFALAGLAAVPFGYRPFGFYVIVSLIGTVVAAVALTPLVVLVARYRTTDSS
jgi:hypothetical protein